MGGHHKDEQGFTFFFTRHYWVFLYGIGRRTIAVTIRQLRRHFMATTEQVETRRARSQSSAQASADSVWRSNCSEAGIDDFVIVEAAGEVGGTWRDSRYPGAAVDVPNHLYSYSFSSRTLTGRACSRSAARDPAVHSRHVADKYDLRKKTLFNTKGCRSRKL
jgi:hypothetical protein